MWRRRCQYLVNRGLYRSRPIGIAPLDRPVQHRAQLLVRLDMPDLTTVSATSLGSLRPSSRPGQSAGCQTGAECCRRGRRQRCRHGSVKWRSRCGRDRNVAPSPHSSRLLAGVASLLVSLQPRKLLEQTNGIVLESEG